MKRMVVFAAGLIFIAGVGMYFFSDVYKTKMDAAVTDLTKWTPDNIASNPAGYLDFCEAETNNAFMDMKASEIAIAQNRARLVGMKEDATNKIRVGDAALVELKDTYGNAETESTWPVTWRGEPRDKDWVKRQIVAINNQVESQKRLLGKIETGIRNLEAQTAKIQDARAKSQEQLAEIKASREMLRAQNLSTELTDRLVAMRGVLQATISTASDATGVVSLDQLAIEQEGTIDDAEFDKIMESTGK